MQPLEQLKKDLITINRLKYITRALQQDAAHYLRERREKIINSRSYFREAWRVYGILRRLVDYAPELINKKIVILINPNQGIYGRLLNRALAKAKELYIREKADILITGKKGQSSFANLQERTTYFFELSADASYEDILPIKKIIARYSQIIIVYGSYISTAKQKVAVATFKPEGEKRHKEEEVLPKNYIIEPNIQEVMDYFNEVLAGVIFYSYFAESMLAFKAAEMILMENGYNNAEDMEKKQRLKLFRVQREIKDSKLRDLFSGRRYNARKEKQI